jgi:hypothetical protein
MIRDKNRRPIQPAPLSNEPEVIVPEIQTQNAFVDMYKAVSRAILTIREVEDDTASPPFFKTIALDNGQFGRIIRDENREMEIAFPAVFVHFINVRYLVQQQRIGEGRATMRIRFNRRVHEANHDDLP